MTSILNIILLTSIWCLGITAATQPNMLLYGMRQWAEEKQSNTKNKVYEPLVLCHWCMPSIHSIIGYSAYAIIGSFQWWMLALYPIVICGSCILNGVVWALYHLISNAAKYYENAEKLAYFDIKERKQKYHQSSQKRSSHG